MERIAAIETRCQVVKMTLHELCCVSSVAYHAVSRWKSGEVNPTVRTLNRDLTKLETKLDEVERQVFEALKPKFLNASAA